MADNIYYLGKCGMVNVKGFRIGGMSGIYKPNNYRKGYFESVPLDEDEMRSVYHTRELETLKFALLEHPVDVLMSHDWPNIATDHGDLATLLRYKPFFEEDVRSRG